MLLSDQAGQGLVPSTAGFTSSQHAENLAAGIIPLLITRRLGHGRLLAAPDAAAPENVDNTQQSALLTHSSAV